MWSVTCRSLSVNPTKPQTTIFPQHTLPINRAQIIYNIIDAIGFTAVATMSSVSLTPSAPPLFVSTKPTDHKLPFNNQHRFVCTPCTGAFAKQHNMCVNQRGVRVTMMIMPFATACAWDGRGSVVTLNTSTLCTRWGRTICCKRNVCHVVVGRERAPDQSDYYCQLSV